MTLTSALLTPVLLALAFLLQGCFFADYKPSVQVSIARLCDKKVDGISDEKGLKEIVGGDEGCDSMDKKVLDKFRVTDCSAILHDFVRFALGAECEASAARDGDVKEACPARDEDKDPKNCLPTVEAAVDRFAPSKEPEEFSMGAGFEAGLGLLQECARTLTERTSEDAFQDSVTSSCNVQAFRLDAHGMKAMEVTAEDCNGYFVKQFVKIGSVACLFAVKSRKDAPLTGWTYEWMQIAVKESTDPWFAEGQRPFARMLDDLPDPSPAGRLRLYASIREWAWAGQPGRPWSAHAVPVSAASALVFAALVGLARRRLAATESRPQGAEPILEEEEAQPAAREHRGTPPHQPGSDRARGVAESC